MEKDLLSILIFEGLSLIEDLTETAASLDPHLERAYQDPFFQPAVSPHALQHNSLETIPL